MCLTSQSYIVYCLVSRAHFKQLLAWFPKQSKTACLLSFSYITLYPTSCCTHCDLVKMYSQAPAHVTEHDRVRMWKMPPPVQLQNKSVHVCQHWPMCAIVLRQMCFICVSLGWIRAYRALVSLRQRAMKAEILSGPVLIHSAKCEACGGLQGCIIQLTPRAVTNVALWSLLNRHMCNQSHDILRHSQVMVWREMLDMFWLVQTQMEVQRRIQTQNKERLVDFELHFISFISLQE